METQRYEYITLWTEWTSFKKRSFGYRIGGPTFFSKEMDIMSDEFHNIILKLIRKYNNMERLNGRRRMIKEKQSTCHWICLSSCHLGINVNNKIKYDRNLSEKQNISLIRKACKKTLKDFNNKIGVL